MMSATSKRILAFTIMGIPLAIFSCAILFFPYGFGQIAVREWHVRNILLERGIQAQGTVLARQERIRDFEVQYQYVVKDAHGEQKKL